MKEIILSSKFTKIGLYLGALILLIISPIILNLFSSQPNKFHIDMLIGGGLFLVMIGFLIYSNS